MKFLVAMSLGKSKFAYYFRQCPKVTNIDLPEPAYLSDDELKKEIITLEIKLFSKYFTSNI